MAVLMSLPRIRSQTIWTLRGEMRTYLRYALASMFCILLPYFVLVWPRNGFVAPELIKRVEEMNKTGEKKVLKTWSRSSTIFPAFGRQARGPRRRRGGGRWGS